MSSNSINTNTNGSGDSLASSPPPTLPPSTDGSHTPAKVATPDIVQQQQQQQASPANNTTSGGGLGVVRQPTTPEALSEAWKAYNINKRKGALDMQAAALADTRANSSASRKRLIKETGDYRKLPASDPGKVSKAGALLKLYQEEIDNITKRCKAAEGAFSDAYRNLIEVPDVSLAVSTMLDERARGHRAAEMEIENKRLRDELEAYRQEFAELKNQQVTIRRLEAQAKDLQKDAADARQAAAEEHAAAEEERRRGARLEEALAEKDAAVQQLQGEAARALKASQDSQATLLNLRSSFEAQTAALRSEIDILTAELDKKNAALLHRAGSLSPEQQQQQQQTTMTESGEPGNDDEAVAKGGENAAATELKVAQQEIEIARLEHALAELAEHAAAEKKGLEERAAQLEAQLAGARSEKEALERAKPSPAEYARLLRDYEALRALVADEPAGSSLATTASPATAATDKTGNAESGFALASSTESVEQMLYGKSRRLEAENARLRTRVDELETLGAQQKATLSHLGEENTRMRSLVERLEDQLSQHTPEAAAAAAASSSTGMGSAIAAAMGSSVSPSQPSPVEAPQAGSATTVLEIVCSQRDRFRDRIAELEADKSQLMEALERTENTVKSLRADNVKLYERVKFLQSYSNSSNGSGSSGSSVNRKSGKGMGFDDEIDSKYGRMYEDAANPFMEFSKRERMRKIRELNATDRFLFKSTRVLMSNKYIRLGFFVYMIFLHILVFASLFKMAGSVTAAPPVFVEGQPLQ